LHHHRLVRAESDYYRSAIRSEILRTDRLFPASLLGTAGDVAAVSSCLSLLPKGRALAKIDFTIKMTGVAKGEKLTARGRVLQDGRTNSVGATDVCAVAAGQEVLCGTVLATTRNFRIKPSD
jgi:acyl-coenzyme A thioesterase PaaI-like protein